MHHKVSVFEEGTRLSREYAHVHTRAHSLIRPILFISQDDKLDVSLWKAAASVRARGILYTTCIYNIPLAYTIYHLHIQQSTCMYCTAASKAAPYVITGHTRDRRHATNVRPHLLLSTATAAFRARAIESRMSCTEDSMAASSCSELPKGNLSHFSTRSARKVNTCMEACTFDPMLPTEERNLNGVVSWSVVGFI